MKRIICFLVLILAVFGVGKGQGAGLHDYPNIAVWPYANKAAMSRQLSLEDVSLVSEFVIEQLLDADRFNVIEREMLEAVLNEHSFNMSVMIDPTSAVEMGRLVGVKYIVVGSVTGLSTKTSGAAYSDTQIGGTGFNTNTVIANVTARFIDVETGRIVLAASGTGESASSNVEFSLGKTRQRKITGSYGTDYANYNYVYTDTVVNRERKVVIGTKSFSQVQVRNALYKAVGDLIYNKDFGVLAKMDGKAKRRKV